jgi:hypothetical protein
MVAPGLQRRPATSRSKKAYYCGGLAFDRSPLLFLPASKTGIDHGRGAPGVRRRKASRQGNGVLVHARSSIRRLFAVFSVPTVCRSESFMLHRRDERIYNTPRPDRRFDASRDYGRPMPAFEYMIISLNEVPPRTGIIDILNHAGKDGWELTSITRNNIAYLKREITTPASKSPPRKPGPLAPI